MGATTIIGVDTVQERLAYRANSARIMGSGDPVEEIVAVADGAAVRENSYLSCFAQLRISERLTLTLQPASSSRATPAAYRARASADRYWPVLEAPPRCRKE